MFFLSFSTVNKCDEWKKHVGHKHTVRATQGVLPVTKAFREFMRDYWLRSYPAETNRTLRREDINAGRILFGHTSYASVFDIDVIIGSRINFFGKNRFYLSMYSPLNPTTKTHLNYSLRIPATYCVSSRINPKLHFDYIPY